MADTVHVVRVPVTVTGTASDKDRIVKAGLPDVDLNTTAEDDQYVIGDGLVKAGELSGFVDLTLYNDDRLSDQHLRGGFGTLSERGLSGSPSEPASVHRVVYQ